MPAGRPTDFKEAYIEGARRLARLGATDAEVADFYDVDVRTVYRWKLKSEEFCQALKEGKAASDARVVRSLYHRAIGYEQDAVKIFMPAGAEGPVYATYRERVAPDTTAAIFWLKNRDPENWRDRQQLEHTGPNSGPIKVEAMQAATLAALARKHDAE